MGPEINKFVGIISSTKSFWASERYSFLDTPYVYGVQICKYRYTITTYSNSQFDAGYPPLPRSMVRYPKKDF